jgi:hypothetical protein
MSLPTFKLNPTNSQVNSGFSPDAKLKTSGGIQDIISNAKDFIDIQKKVDQKVSLFMEESNEYNFSK